MPMCPGPIDYWNHLRDCQFYDTKWDNSWKLESEIAAYLVKVSRERYIKVKRPLHCSDEANDVMLQEV